MAKLFICGRHRLRQYEVQAGYCRECLHEQARLSLELAELVSRLSSAYSLEGETETRILTQEQWMQLKDKASELKRLAEEK